MLLGAKVAARSTHCRSRRSSASACPRQYVIPISRYIAVAVVRCSCTSSLVPVLPYSLRMDRVSYLTNHHHLSIWACGRCSAADGHRASPIPGISRNQSGMSGMRITSTWCPMTPRAAASRAPTAPARLSGMLCRHPAAVNGERAGGISADDTSPRTHDGGHRAPTRSGSRGVGRGWGGIGARPSPTPSQRSSATSESRRSSPARR